MLRIEEDSVGRVKVIGRLCGEAALTLLEDALLGGAMILDASGVLQADERAVSLLAGLRPECVSIVSAPAWLALWVERARCAEQSREPPSLGDRKGQVRE